MHATADYSAAERMRDGRDIEIRALTPGDKDDLLTAVGRTGTESLRRRFFTLKRNFSEKEIAFFVNVDFTNHVALIALADEDGHKVIIGGRRLSGTGRRHAADASSRRHRPQGRTE
jgi:RNase P/RNase MRP subunit POP5